MDTNKMLLAAVLAFQVFISLGGCRAEPVEHKTVTYNIYVTQNNVYGDNVVGENK